jgi:glycine/D-amino acid oxidase-like deaminating enzyme
MIDTSILASDFRERPYWMDALPAKRTAADEPAVPASADVVVVGAGLTGVAAAWELATAGRDVVVLDAGEPGAGASSRNAGMLGRHFKHSFGELMHSLGIDAALAYFSELNAAYQSAVDRIRTEKLDCEFRLCGRLIGALSRAHHERLVKEYELRERHLGEQVRFIAASDSTELGSQRYHGGVHVLDNGSLQPALYASAMRRRAERAGARIVGHCPVVAVVRDGQGFEVHTQRGTIRARDVLIATNGYTGELTPWLVKRLIPIHAYMIATEPLSADVLRGLLPAHRTYLDNRRTSNYMQLSPDGKRLLFGGKTGHRPPTLRQLASDLSRDMCFLFPQLEGVKISHAWTGRCAATADLFPHTGVHDRMHYALGYCFSGNAMAPYLGTKAAKRILGSADARTIFAKDDFPKVPWPARQARLMPIVMRYYEWADRPTQRLAAP